MCISLLQENAVPDYPLHDSNPLNEDPPETLEDFLSDLNVSAIGYIEEVAYYQQVLEELGETNMLVEQFINMVCIWHSQRSHTWVKFVIYISIESYGTYNSGSNVIAFTSTVSSLGPLSLLVVGLARPHVSLKPT